MTNQEFSIRFDVLYNNIMSSQAPGLDEYEKGVFLNKAQLELLKNRLNPKGNKYAEGFDGSSKRQVEFSKLVVNADMPFDETTVTENDVEVTRPTFTVTVDTDGMLSILNESVTVTRNGADVNLVVVPINNVELDTLMSRPYKYPPRSQAWRVITDDGFRIITNDAAAVTNRYHIRYVRLPHEIDLTDATKTCELPDTMHDEILQRAVELAKAAYVSDATQQQIIQALGERSE